ncbi:MAG TPA: FkbM family methyltransferase [Gammaproteobacteria bacterium]|nr:FkbM family methyltransferase [Gammaproteobacteria bacterium]
MIAEGSQSDLISHARAVREMTRLGLLPQAAGFVDEEVKQLTASSRKPEVEKARVEVLRTEIDALQNKLILAQQRQQLFRPSYHQPEAEDHSQRVNNIKQKAVSQLGQDIWVLEKTNYKRNGFFVEFGATDGVLLSNTYLLEKEFGWNGICAEPNPKFHEQLRANRGCIVSQHCIAGKTGEQVEFILADAFGGMRRYADDDQHQEKREAYRLSGEVAIMTTISLDDFLKHYNAPREIDYLSIDTEGSEYEILASFPFDEWKIRLITVEHNFTDRRSDIRALLEKNGYRCTEMQWDDWYEIV